MKIGEFAKKYDVPISTVRYYIDEELLTAKKNGAQYDFDEINEFEMQILLDLRESAFSLEEMRRFINISRVFDENDPALYKELKSLFNDKKVCLSKQILDIKSTIKTIDSKLDALTSKEAVLTRSNNIRDDSAHKNGLPLDFLAYLSCPDCGSSPDLDNVRLSDGKIISGTFRCSCGYEGRIEDGIIYVDKDIDLDQDPTFCDDYFFDPAAPENEPIFYECFLSVPQNYLSISYKARNWMHETIRSGLQQPGIILFPDMASVFPYLYNNAEYLQNATLVIMSLSRKAITAIRKHISILDSDLNIVYIVSVSNRLPLKKKSIDLMIDCMGTFNYAFFFDKPLYEYIDPYFSDDASIVGCLSYYDPSAQSNINITGEYSRAMDPFLSLDSYIGSLTSHGYSILDNKQIGSNTVPSEYIHYHEYGEKLYLHTVFASRRRNSK